MWLSDGESHVKYEFWQVVRSTSTLSCIHLKCQNLVLVYGMLSNQSGLLYKKAMYLFFY